MKIWLVIDLSTLPMIFLPKKKKTAFFKGGKPTKTTIFPMENPHGPRLRAAFSPRHAVAWRVARYHGSNAMSSAQEAMQIAAEALHQQWPGSIDIDII